MACSPAPNAHWPGEPAGAGASALACPLFDCAANCAGWQGLQTSEPAYWLACCPMAAAAKSKASMPLENDRNLPDKSAAILELPPVNPGLLRRDAPKDGSSGDAQVRIGSAEAVGDVVAFQAQLELDAFLYREHLGQRHVHVDKTRPLHVVVLQRIGAPGERRLDREHRRIEPAGIRRIVDVRVAAHQFGREAEEISAVVRVQRADR